MLRGLYTAAAGMLTVTTSTDALAGNLANVNTTGYKANRMNFQTFPEMLINRLDRQEQQAVGSLVNGSQVYRSFISFTPGAVHETGGTLDMAIHGDGFFTVKSPEGKTFYTRAGNFSMDAQGYLITQNGDYVQGAQGNIQINSADQPVMVTQQGTITAKGRTVGQLSVARFQDNQTLERVSDNLYQTTPASRPATGGAGFKVQQGALEESNVNPVMELVNNIQGMRLYEALQKNIHMHNEALGKAVNDVGRYR